MAVWWLQLTTTTTTTATTRWTTTTTTATVTNNRNRNIRDKRTQTETYRNNRSKTTSWWAVTKLLLLRFKIPKSARCNIQYAVDPMSSEFRIIEVNARHLAGRMVFLGAFLFVRNLVILKVNSQQVVCWYLLGASTLTLQCPNIAAWKSNWRAGPPWRASESAWCITDLNREPTIDWTCHVWKHLAVWDEDSKAICINVREI